MLGAEIGATADTRNRAEEIPQGRDPLLDTVSLYLHIPFCHAKCHYCDFNSYAGMLGMRERYVDALLREIAYAGERSRHPDGAARRCRTIFLGGGTPSLLLPEQVRAILDAARSAFALDADAEITLEANPGTLEYGRLDEMRAAGINRLSMGAQSFDADLLRWMGRIHTPEEIESAFHAGRAAGFGSINLDFIYALPGQSLATWEATLQRALALAPDHLSLYSLIVEEGTPLFRWVAQGKVTPAEDDLAADMYECASALLARAGYQHYEISNWARPGHECQHNLTYWRNLPYIGLGAGAHGWTGRERYAETRPIRDYLARVAAGSPSARVRAGDDPPALAVVERETVSAALAMTETAFLGLRLVEGLDLARFERRFGVTFDAHFGARLAALDGYGLLERSDGTIRLSERGLLLGNEVFERLLPEQAATA
ncbi:MAG TPA: radical SAM family heme chaperone HemW [Ktedonobacterales bacterium]|nr:radical SAM family heme chaperone HemW [Ktedonobacterales bacterium]